MQLAVVIVPSIVLAEVSELAMMQHHQVRMRAVVRSGFLTTTGLIFAGLAVVAAVLWWVGRLP